MSQKWSHNFVLGYTDTETAMLDFDRTDLETVKFWARSANRFFKLGGFIILESSENNYHVVFNRRVSWSENMRIVASVTLRSHNRGLRRWQLMQCRKQSSSLRVSPKGEKPSPQMLFREGKQDDRIKEYLEYVELIERISQELSSSHAKDEYISDKKT